MSDLPEECPPLPFKTNTRFELAGTLLEESIRKICISLDAMAVAVAHTHGQALMLGDVDPRSWFGLAARVSGLTVIVPSLSVLEHAFRGLDFEGIFIEFRDDFECPPALVTRDASKIHHFFYDTAAAQFVLFFERHYETMKRLHNFNYDAIHNTWTFGRRIRDAISHGDIFTINDRNFKPITWRGYTIGPQKNGVTLSDTFTAGDLIVLMCELEIALPNDGSANPWHDK